MIEHGQDFCFFFFFFLPFSRERKIDKGQRFVSTISYGSAAIERLLVSIREKTVYVAVKNLRDCDRQGKDPALPFQNGARSKGHLDLISFQLWLRWEEGGRSEGRDCQTSIWDNLFKEWKVTWWENWHFALLSQCCVCSRWVQSGSRCVQSAIVFFLVMGSTWKPFQTSRAWLIGYKLFHDLIRKVGKLLV